MLTLVTGATGLLGNNIVRQLVDRGEGVRVLSRAADPPSLAGLEIERARGDVTDAASVCAASKGVSRIIHAAGHVHIGWTQLDQHRRTNVEGTRNVAKAAAAAGVRMVHVSTVDAVGIGTMEQPATEETAHVGHVMCPYVVTKREAEMVLGGLHGEGLDVVIVNPAYLIGPWDWKPSSGRMLLQVSRGKAVLAPPGGNDFCDVRDVAAGTLAAAERGVSGRRYILSGESLKYFDAWTIMAEITGRRPPRGITPRWLLRFGGRMGDRWGRFTGREPDTNTATVAIAKLPHHYSSARAQRELGYHSRPLRESAAAAWKWFQEHGYQ